MQENISGIQQIGVGISNVNEAFKWYRQNLGFDIPVVDAPGTAELMLKYTGNKPQNRHAIIAVNIQGGGGLEIWQYMDRTPKAAEFQVQTGDLGIYITKIKSSNVIAAFNFFKSRGEKLIGELQKDFQGNPHFFVEDPFGNIFQIVREEHIFKRTQSYTGGVFGAIVGVSDIEKSIEFYKNVLGYDKIIYSEEGIFPDFSALPRGDSKFSRVLLTHSNPRQGAFSHLLGSSQIELIKIHDIEPKKIYENRFWGDLGFIQICYDVTNMGAIKNHCEANGRLFTVDSNPEIYEKGGEIFGMGDAAGHFTYIEDPDGTLIEFVETHKIPILKKIGWYLNLKKRNQQKPLPNWMLRTLAWGRIKD